MAAGDLSRVLVEVLELEVDRCTLTYGVAPCTASAGAGNECYNTFRTCQDRANYTKGTKVYAFCGRGAPTPDGETCRPYVSDVKTSPTELPELAGLARRNSTTITLVDEPDLDVDQDPYRANRASPAQGTFWSRWLARNHNYSGRVARLKRGYFTPDSNGRISYTLADAGFTAERYIIESIRRTTGGDMQVVLKDPLKVADRAKIPTPTDGKLMADLKAIEQSGTAVAATSTTIRLTSAASAVDDYYNGYEVYITENTGAGQRRVITDYTGATREAVVAAWGTVPDTTSRYEVGALQLTLDAGKGAKYRDPAVTGRREFLRIGEEVIEYTARSGDVLSWPDTTYRNAFSDITTTKKDHRANDNVQQCLAWIDAPAATILEQLHNESGIADADMDLTGLAAEADIWLRSPYNITVCLTEPEDASKVIDDLLLDFTTFEWWSPADQKLKFKVNAPQVSSSYAVLTPEANLIEDSLSITPQDDKRVTRASIYYHPQAATANLREAKNYLRGAVYVDTDAESAAEYGDVRPLVRYSRWFRNANATAAAARVSRAISWLRDAPRRVQFRVDPKDRASVSVGSLVAIRTRELPNADGSAKDTVLRVIKSLDDGRHTVVDAVVTGFANRYAFIAPNGQPDYTSASEAQRNYAYICNASGKMSNGDDGYLII